VTVRHLFLRDFALRGGAIICFSGTALSQEIPAPPAVTLNPVAGAATLTDVLFKKTPSEVWLSCLVVSFGLLVVGAYIFAIRNLDHRRPEDISRALIVVTVITASLLLITAGYSNQQVAPASGLFGTIVGYMLGRMSLGGPDNSSGGASKPKGEQPDEPGSPQT